MPKTLLLACSTALAALLFSAAPAFADTQTFANPDPIAIPGSGTSGPGSPYPSAVFVTGMTGPITDVNVTLFKVGHQAPGDMQVVLVAPSGKAVVLMSANCALPIDGYTWTFDQQVPQVMGLGGCNEIRYRPAARVPIDLPAPGPPGPYETSLDELNREQPTGKWDLYVTDRNALDKGDMKGGWALTLTTGPVDATIPGANGSGTADPYPMTRTLPDTNAVVTDLTVRIEGIWHRSPDDLDMLLVGPRGQKVVLMSDACGTHPVAAYSWDWNDDAPAPMPDGDGTEVCTVTTHRPTDYEPGDVWPAPAPPGPYAGALSAFDLTDPQGEWRLFVNDDNGDTGGFFTHKFELLTKTRPKATVAFTESAVQVAEGATRALTLERSGATTLGAGTVTVTSAPGSATSGSDFTPVSTVVQFAAGEKQKTVPVSALTDGAVEPDETFAVSLGAATGDAQVGTRSSVAVTIPAPTVDPTPTTGETPPASPETSPAGDAAVAPAVPGVAGTAAAAGAPKLSAAAIKRRGKRLTLEFTLDADASVRTTIGQKIKRGRRAAVVVRGRQTVAGKAGRNRVALGTKRLRRGRYTLELVAAAGGQSSAPTKLAFAYRSSRK